MFKHLHPSILLALHGGFDPLRASFIEDEGGGDEGGGDPAPAPKFTQDDIDRIVTSRLRKSQGEQTAMASQLEEMKARLEEMRVANEGKGDEDAAKRVARQLEQSQEQIKTLQAEREQLANTATAASQSRDAYIIQQQATQALLSSGVLTSALGHATADFIRNAELETVDGKHTVIVRVDGVPYEDSGDGKELAKAAAKYLAANTFYQAAKTGSGSGSPTSGGKGPPMQGMEGAPIGVLLNHGLSTPIK